MAGFRYGEVKCFSYIEDVGSDYNLNAYYFFNLRSNYSTIYVRGKLGRNGEVANINRRLDFITEFNDGNRIVLKDSNIRLNFGDQYSGYDINSFIPLDKNPHDSKVIFDVYKQLDGSFIIQKTNGHMIYCNI